MRGVAVMLAFCVLLATISTGSLGSIFNSADEPTYGQALVDSISNVIESGTGIELTSDELDYLTDLGLQKYNVSEESSIVVRDDANDTILQDNSTRTENVGSSSDDLDAVKFIFNPASLTVQLYYRELDLDSIGDESVVLTSVTINANDRDSAITSYEPATIIGFDSNATEGVTDYTVLMKRADALNHTADTIVTSHEIDEVGKMVSFTVPYNYVLPEEDEFETIENISFIVAHIRLNGTELGNRTLFLDSIPNEATFIEIDRDTIIFYAALFFSAIIISVVILYLYNGNTSSKVIRDCTKSGGVWDESNKKCKWPKGKEGD